MSSKSLPGMPVPAGLSVVVFFFSDHGISDAKERGHLVVADSYTEDLYGSSLPIDDVVSNFQQAGGRKSLLVLDACREYFQKNKWMSKRGLLEERYEQAELAATFYATKAGRCASLQEGRPELPTWRPGATRRGMWAGMVTILEAKPIRWGGRSRTSWEWRGPRPGVPWQPLRCRQNHGLALITGSADRHRTA